METGRYKPLIDTNGTLTNYNYERHGREFAAVRFGADMCQSATERQSQRPCLSLAARLSLSLIVRQIP